MQVSPHSPWCGVDGASTHVHNITTCAYVAPPGTPSRDMYTSHGDFGYVISLVRSDEESDILSSSVSRHIFCSVPPVLRFGLWHRPPGYSTGLDLYAVLRQRPVDCCLRHNLCSPSMYILFHKPLRRTKIKLPNRILRMMKKPGSKVWPFFSETPPSSLRAS